MVCDFSAPPFDPSVRYRLVEDRTTYAVGHDGTVWSRCSGEWKPLKPSPQKSGHLRVWLGGGRANMRFVHRLVLEAFVGPCPEGMSSSLHHDDDPSNNRLSNLSWGTQKDNYADAVRNGRIKVGDESPKAKLTSGEVLEIVRRCRGEAGRRRQGLRDRRPQHPRDPLGTDLVGDHGDRPQGADEGGEAEADRGAGPPGVPPLPGRRVPEGRGQFAGRLAEQRVGDHARRELESGDRTAQGATHGRREGIPAAKPGVR
jgi:hypothetical protein